MGGGKELEEGGSIICKNSRNYPPSSVYSTSQLPGGDICLPTI